MKKKILIAVIVIILLVLLIPIPMRLKDGGTIEYKALIYTVSKVHKLNHNSASGYDNGLIIKIFGFSGTTQPFGISIYSISYLPEINLKSELNIPLLSVVNTSPFNI